MHERDLSWTCSCVRLRRWSADSAHVLTSRSTNHTHVHTHACRTGAIWTRSVQYDCDVVRESFETLTLRTTGWRHTGPLYVISYDYVWIYNYLKLQLLGLNKKAGAGLICNPWPWPRSPGLSDAFHSFRGHWLTRPSKHVIKVFYQLPAIVKSFTCVFFCLTNFCLIY